jgi:hypothetical protein
MKSKRIFSAILLIVFLAIVMLLWWCHPVKPDSKPSPVVVSSYNEDSNKASRASAQQRAIIPDSLGTDIPPEDKEQLEIIGAIYRAPIDFWGQVIDQNRQPVAGAKISYSAVQKYFKDATPIDGGYTDGQGYFFKTGMSGSSVLVSVYKEGYYATDQSGRRFGYGMPSGDSPPTKETPAIFVLHKAGEAEPLMKLETGGVKLSPNGSPKKLSLRTARGQRQSQGDGDLQIELWSGYQPPPPHGNKYDWRVRIAVPGGGLVERESGFNFEAPEQGYNATWEHSMSANAERWQANVKKEFFLKLADGCFARAEITIVAGGDIFAVFKSYLNPATGHRNLEFDPTKVIKPTP